jgi:Site-specific recombinases, DNA invertase Pin homologs
MSNGKASDRYLIGIYVRESRDDNEENYETIETQKGLLIDFAKKNKLGEISDIYIDDNVSGSSFERIGLGKLKEDIEDGKIDLLLIKDLSRLGRNNAKTLLFLDYLEEYGVRVVTYDGKFDSSKDNETVGIETWINERYVRDISKKIRASLKYKINKGEYIGNAPYGYKKSIYEKNRLCIDEESAGIVKFIYNSYLEGYGYSSVAAILNEKGLKSPGGSKWNSIAVRRILCNRVYMGDTVQGVSEKISFKSRKTRRLPQSDWVVTEQTHSAIIDKAVFETAQKLRQGRNNRISSPKGQPHILSGMAFCGKCGSLLYARSKNKTQTFYICGNYYKHGRESCTSHFIWEEPILDIIMKELLQVMESSTVVKKLEELNRIRSLPGQEYADKLQKLELALASKQKQQEILYMDRLEEKITYELFTKVNKSLEDRIVFLKEEIENLACGAETYFDMKDSLAKVRQKLKTTGVTSEIARYMVNRITVFDPGDELDLGCKNSNTSISLKDQHGFLIIDFKINKVYD